MLSDHEQRTLRELERQLVTEDPDFPRSFDARAERLGRPRVGVSAMVAGVVAALLAGLMLLAGSPAGALAFAGGTVLIWLGWCHSTGALRPPAGPPATEPPGNDQ